MEKIMPALKYRVRLSRQEREELEGKIRSGQERARVLTRARILLKADAGKIALEIGEAVGVTERCVEDVRKRYCEGGLQSALYDKPRPGAKRKLDGKQEAHLIAQACSDPPKGHVHWTLKLLADRLVQLEIVDAITPETVRQILKKTNLSLGKKKNGVFRRSAVNS